ncbi:MAG: hypothetical protein CUN56_03530 [Phototrophicales bacterium]|nr:MAG: hypothetical protein CUN56_03530 [Phototrophicales bacterium]RMG77653.1 MAG: hypothetical protein D6711_01055 [Chloroflexota bacterium]
MGSRLRLMIITLGWILVAATFTYPLWRNKPDIGEIEAEFTELSAEQLREFFRLPAPIQAGFSVMHQQNPIMATDLLLARLNPPEPINDPMPPVGNAVVVRTGRLTPLQLAQDDTRELPPFSNLFGASGNITIYRYPDNRMILRIENLQAVHGPDLALRLVENTSPLTPEDIGNNYIELSPVPMPSNVGNLNFQIPASVNLNDYGSVVIYERLYELIYAVAPLQRAG